MINKHPVNNLTDSEKNNIVKFIGTLVGGGKPSFCEDEYDHAYTDILFGKQDKIEIVFDEQDKIKILFDEQDEARKLSTASYGFEKFLSYCSINEIRKFRTEIMGFFVIAIKNVDFINICNFVEEVNCPQTNIEEAFDEIKRAFDKIVKLTTGRFNGRSFLKSKAVIGKVAALKRLLTHFFTDNKLDQNTINNEIKEDKLNKKIVYEGRTKLIIDNLLSLRSTMENVREQKETSSGDDSTTEVINQPFSPN